MAADSYPFTAECELVPNADVMLYGKSNVVTSDAMILNECVSWLNFASEIIDEELPDTRIIPLDILPENERKIII